MFRKNRKEIFTVWNLNLCGLILNVFSAILIFYSLGAHPCANPFSACGGTTGGLHMAYVNSPFAANLGLFFLLIGFIMQLIAHILSKHK